MKKVKKSIKGYTYRRKGRIVRVPNHRRTYHEKVNLGATFGSLYGFEEGRNARERMGEGIKRREDIRVYNQNLREAEKTRAREFMKNINTENETRDRLKRGYGSWEEEALDNLKKGTKAGIVGSTKAIKKQVEIPINYFKKVDKKNKIIDQLSAALAQEEIDKTFMPGFEPTEKRRRELEIKYRPEARFRMFTPELFSTTEKASQEEKGPEPEFDAEAKTSKAKTKRSRKKKETKEEKEETVNEN